MPYEANSGRIYYITEKEKQAGEYSMATLVDLNNIDFDDFTFGLASRPTFIPVNSKEKKVKMISVKVENGNLNEGFGIFKIALSYTTAKNIK